VKILASLTESIRQELPAASLARWASAFFSLFVLTLVISLALSQALLVTAAALYAAHLLRDRSAICFLPVKLPLALFCITTVISIFWAANPTVGWFAVRKLTLFLIWLLAVNLVVSGAHLRRLFQGLFLTSAIAGIVGVMQFVIQYREVHALHPHRLYFYVTISRIHGFMGHWMNFGGQQMLVFSSLLAFLLLQKGSRTNESSTSSGRHFTLVWWLTLAILALSLILNFTRGVWLGCFVATVYLVARWKPRWLLALPVLLAIGYVTAPSLVRERVYLALRPYQDPALSIRLEMWKVAIRMIRAHPWVGVGPNNIVEAYPLYLPPRISPIAGYHDHLHNNFFQFAAERGLPCLIAWVWLMAALGWHTWKIRSKSAKQRWVADATLAGWLAFLAEGCFEFNFGTSPVLMVFLFLTSTPFIIARLQKPETGTGDEAETGS
jgi:putative inorganic carbon (HCO3(-)) transporter